MRVTLKCKNSDHTCELILVQKKDELLICSEEGNHLATIDVVASGLPVPEDSENRVDNILVKLPHVYNAKDLYFRK